MNTKRLLIIVLTAAALTAVYMFFLQDKSADKEVKKEYLTVKKHSESFNAGIDKLMTAYFDLKNSFVDGDTAAVKQKAQLFITALNNIDTLELKKDTASVYTTVMFTLTDMRLNTESILNQHDLQEMRKDFSSLSDMMYPAFFQTINYEGATIYLQNCPMAFDDSIPANWINETMEVINPYLGKKHPVYQAGMLHCGEIKDSIGSK